MPIRVLSRNYGLFNPRELALLQEVFEEACIESGAPIESSEAEDIARHALSAYQNGHTDKAALLAAIRPPVRVFAANSG